MILLRFGTLWQYLQQVLSYAVPPFVALFVIGLFWKRATATAAFGALVLGHATAVGIFAFQQADVVSIPFLYIPAILLVVSGAALVFISRVTPAPTEQQVRDYTWTLALFRAETVEMAALLWYQNYRVQSVLLLVHHHGGVRGAVLVAARPGGRTETARHV